MAPLRHGLVETAPPRDHGKKRRGRVKEAALAEADALISLPPDALDNILVRLGIRDAVRTSALSRVWRHRWEALPYLDLHFPRLGGDEGAPAGLWSLYGILLRCPGRVRLFHAELDGPYAGRVHDWLFVLSRRGVEILDLSFNDSFPTLPSSVFSCSRLTSLSLFGCAIPLLPAGFVAFPDLKKLTLANVHLEDYGEYQLEEIIRTSPLLEYLVLTDVFIDGEHIREWVIRAPNLRHLTICSENYYGWILKDLTCLNSAVIDWFDNVVHHDFAKFLSGLVQVRKLLVVSFNAPSAMIPKIILCTFHNLKSLKLRMHFCEQPPIMLAFCLLKSAPNLEKLKIEIYDKEEQKFEANGEFQNALWTDGMCANLQVVQMTGINWRRNEMCFIELILSKARLLRALFISYGGNVVMSSEDAINELLTYKRASAEAQVLFKGKAEEYY
ncbi:hypothetical protein CFC21_071596 [Triticum aestivum]|uniref:F-box domain-containing protein n=4 Tax=Triticinae TaxID=1648030 RepID=A0A9R0X941_TRITD|nr:F-box/FBD/LRR-repeat protein At1g13570-like isoform X1 [Triticum aestivum]KAF7065498.1 hypothetical protein CFC21_071596 [Triticum aestivum]VAI32374.1 unnamed protein product [Triticum turgidum subsp. durum]